MLMHRVYPILNKIQGNWEYVCLCCIDHNVYIFEFLGFKQAITDVMKKLDDLAISKYIRNKIEINNRLYFSLSTGKFFL
jgi:hypothetical protein